MITIQGNDVYFLIVTPHAIVINENYNGLQILDYDFRRKNIIQFSHSVSIYQAYTKNNELLMYCPDDGYIFYAISHTSKRAVTIPLPPSLQDTVLSPVYNWTGVDPILSDYNYNFYRISLSNMRMDQAEEIKISNPLFYKFYSDAIGNRADHICSQYYQYIFTNENNNCVTFVDVKDNIRKSTHLPSIRFHDCRYRNGIFMFVSEKAIVLIHDNQRIASIESIAPFAFLRAEFLNETSFILLSGDQTDPKINKLTIYEINNA